MNPAIAEKPSGSTTILVSNLAEAVREGDVRSLFEQYGFVSAIRLVPSAANRRGDGCCYLEMRDRPAKAAISALDGKVFMGSILRVGETPSQPGTTSERQRTAQDERTRDPTQPIYEVALVEKTAMPADVEGDDWYRYVLSSGKSRITGFHRGSRATVEEYASHCVEELNLRSRRGKSARPMAPAKKK
jgi:RNA recognition motif-containing protein